ncbi:ribose 5-phosphate isomerase B [Alphaproteobacteria bacterium]|nr:ribose 5-phosphate isomerase B [Alphaproteobacteria bacterium]
MKKQLQILIASDHAGFDLKESLKKYLREEGHKIQDLGCDSSTLSVDYPDYAYILCEKFDDQNELQRGILICGSGIGVCIASNRFKKIRSALCYEPKLAELSRAHNDANVLCLGARFIENDQAIKIVRAFLETNFEGSRHAARVSKLGR